MKASAGLLGSGAGLFGSLGAVSVTIIAVLKQFWVPRRGPVARYCRFEQL